MHVYYFQSNIVRGKESEKGGQSNIVRGKESEKGGQNYIVRGKESEKGGQECLQCCLVWYLFLLSLRVCTGTLTATSGCTTCQTALCPLSHSMDNTWQQVVMDAVGLCLWQCQKWMILFASLCELQ